jgi:thiol-disulfide isomerase/thioredoxin
MFERLLLALLFVMAGITAYLLYNWWHLRSASRYTSALDRPAVLYFRSDHCAPCVTQARFLEQIQRQFGDGLAVEKIDADVQPQKAQRYGVVTLPTTLIVDRDGIVRHANYGLADARKLARQLEAVMAG